MAPREYLLSSKHDHFLVLHSEEYAEAEFVITQPSHVQRVLVKDDSKHDFPLPHLANNISKRSLHKISGADVENESTKIL